MATVPGPAIQVFAMFPLDPTNTECPNWNWVHCLTFPLDTLTKLQFTSKLYKWIRYAIGVVVGAQGHLSFNRDSQIDVMDYDQDLPYDSANLYYHSSDIEREHMFPVDPNMGRTTVTSSVATSHRVDFRSEIIARDGNCVLTAWQPRYCDAVHLLAHSKGNKYIENFTRRRSRDSEEKDFVSNIDDIRNGILLNPNSHRSLGKEVAFLMSPNFAMSTNDVDPTATPTARRCTAHLFDPDSPEALGTARSGDPVRMPADAAKWPPDILFDVVYADAVMRHFATQTMLDALEQWKSQFYPEGITSARQADYQELGVKQATKSERRSEQSEAHGERAAKRARRVNDDFDLVDALLILPYLMVPPDKREEVWKRAAEKSAEKERKHVEDKVVGWAEDVAKSSCVCDSTGLGLEESRTSQLKGTDEPPVEGGCRPGEIEDDIIGLNEISRKSLSLE